MLTLILLKYWNVLTTCYAMKKKCCSLHVILLLHSNMECAVPCNVHIDDKFNIQQNCSGCNPDCMFPKLLETLEMLILC